MKEQLNSLRVLLTNDDGISASGLVLLEKLLEPLVNELWVVAPQTDQSGTSHSLTLRQPLRVREMGSKRFSVSGTPADCVLLAVNQIMKDCKPDLVISGINRGKNVGEDVNYSGTIAAAKEASAFGIPAIALSQVIDPVDYFSENKEVDLIYSASKTHCVDLIQDLLTISWPANAVMSINFPLVGDGVVRGVAVTHGNWRKRGDKIITNQDGRGQPYFWIGPREEIDKNMGGSDLEALESSVISVTPLSLEVVEQDVLQNLQESLNIKKTRLRWS